MKRLGHDTFALIFAIAYLVVGTSVLFTLTSLPFFALLYLFDPSRMVLLVAIAALMLFPSLSAAFQVFREFADNGDTSVARNYFRGWYRNLGRSVVIGVAVVGLLLLLLVDLTYLWSTTSAGALLIPGLAVAAFVAATVALYALAINVIQPTASFRAVLKAAVYVPIRHPLLTAVTWITLLALAALVVSFPAAALGVAVAPVLYVVWSNVKYSLEASIARLTGRGTTKTPGQTGWGRWKAVSLPPRGTPRRPAIPAAAKP